MAILAPWLHLNVPPKKLYVNRKYFFWQMIALLSRRVHDVGVSLASRTSGADEGGPMLRVSRPRSQSEEAYGLIRGDILSCRINPGTKILINEVCAKLDFSVGAIREALSRLSAEGLVVAEPQKGFRAAPISPEDLQDLTQMRARIESACLAEAVERGDVAWESRVLAAHHKLVRTPMLSTADSRRLSDAWSLAHSDFHAALADGCGSPWLMRIRGMLYEQSERYRHLSVPLDESRRDVAAEHKALCDAVLDRDRQRAMRLMCEHIEATTNIILRGLLTRGLEATA
jgi:DNA-binding GntR family transcriptional regulator